MIDKIKNLCEKRRIAKFSKENWNGEQERELITLIKIAEKDFKPQNWKDWDSILDNNGYNAEYEIYSNDLSTGCDPITSAPHSIGNTPLEALKYAWKVWSIPPFLICNADYYIKQISIRDVL